MMPSLHVFRGLLLVLAVTLLSGCGTSGPQRHRVHGTVKYKGQPVKTGVVTFILEGAQSAAGGASITNGSYEIPESAGLLEGNYRVAISIPVAPPAKEGETPGETVQPKETLPARYNANTELRSEVKAGADNKFDFDLK